MAFCYCVLLLDTCPCSYGSFQECMKICVHVFYTLPFPLGFWGKCALFLRLRVMLLMLLSVLLWSLSENNCQIAIPYLHLRGQNLTNHSYVDLNEVGTGNNGLQCHTDLRNCCSSAQGDLRGDWYFPSGERLLFTSSNPNSFYEARGAQRVNLYRPSRVTSPTGIFYCKIPYDSNNPLMNETLYVGLYNSSGIIIL